MYLGDRSLASFVKYLLDFVFGVGAILFLFLPKVTRWYLEEFYIRYNEVSYMTLLILLYMSGTGTLLMVYYMRKVFRSLKEGTPFVDENVTSLRNMGFIGLAVSLIFLAKIFILNSIMTFVCTMAFFVGGCFALVLSEVFRSAVEVKKENDYTI